MQASARKIRTDWVGRLKERADGIDERMKGRSGTVLLHYRVGRLSGVAVVPEYEDADTMTREA